jgi:antitoxin (DNA-binding transcriptional repressor) of toxin-antitoxin stability system
MATRTISQRELRNDSAKIIRELQGGTTFVLTNNGIPVGEIRPLHGPQRVVSKEVLVASLAGLPPYGATADDLNAEMDKIVDPYVYDPYTNEPI